MELEFPGLSTKWSMMLSLDHHKWYVKEKMAFCDMLEGQVLVDARAPS